MSKNAYGVAIAPLSPNLCSSGGTILYLLTTTTNASTHDATNLYLVTNSYAIVQSPETTVLRRQTALMRVALPLIHRLCRLL